MSFITIKRILPSDERIISINIDSIIWIQEDEKRTCIMTLDTHEIYVKETRQQVIDAITKAEKD